MMMMTMMRRRSLTFLLLLFSLWLFQESEGFRPPHRRSSSRQQRIIFGRHATPVPSCTTTSMVAMTPPSSLPLIATSDNVVPMTTPSFHLDSLTHSPVFWSWTVMMVIVALLYTWEVSVEIAREKTPPALLPVLESVLGEMGGLGFIGLFVSTILTTPANPVVGQWSQAYLGQPEILWETFEFIHQVFFQAAVAFFLTAAFIIVRVLSSFETVMELSQRHAVAATTTTTTTTTTLVSDEVASILQAPFVEKSSRIGQFLSEDDPQTKIAMEESYLRECNGLENPVWRELRLTRRQRSAETLVLRERVKFEFGLPADYQIYNYLQDVFASAQLDMVKVSPLTWLPLVPAIALANAVDMTHGVANPAAANAVASSGFFLTTPWFIGPQLAIEALCVVWGALNFWKIAHVKAMLVPKVVRLEGQPDGNSIAMGQLLAPDVEKIQVRREWQRRATPDWVAPLETYYARAPHNRVQELFGTVGANGLPFYLNSIKYHTWLTVISLVVFTSQILPRDVLALHHFDTTTTITVRPGNPDTLLPEIAVFGFFAVVNLTLLSLQPTVLLNYCLIAWIENNVQDEEESSVARSSVRVLPVDYPY